MKVLVTVKRVVDYNVKVRAKPDSSMPELNNVKMSINPFCEIAVEEAVRLKESGIATEIVVVSVGDSSCQEQLRTALALGADRAILVSTAIPPQPLGLAKILAKIVDKEQPGIILMGKQSIDGDNNQTGQMLAALTNLPQATFASELQVDVGKVTVTREIDGGLQTLKLSTPAVITTDLRLNTPRYASLPNIMKAKRKPLDELSEESLGVVSVSKVRLLKVEAPSDRKAGIKVDSVDALIDKLKNEAKVIS
jgi:electron transfer flavoprotein beta subunit